MMQVNVERDFKYLRECIVFKMENNEQNKEKPKSSKPLTGVPKNEADISKEGSEEVGIGFPVNEDEFKKMKSKSKERIERNDNSVECTDFSNESES